MATQNVGDSGFFVERVVPDDDNVNAALVAEHVARYHFAAPLVSGLKVLDIACGSGYGTEILAADAASVTGVDFSESAISYAKSKYSNERIGFEVGDAQRLSSLFDGVFDAVVSFETLEHLTDHLSYLQGIRRVLKPGGLFIVSTPDIEFPAKAGFDVYPDNPYHVHEFRRDELVSALSEDFSSIELYGQEYYVPPARVARAFQRMALRVASSPVYQNLRQHIPRGILAAGVAAAGLDTGHAVSPIDSVPGIPRVLIAVCK
jgi:2-polyprenyl-3-methyl-5-hydroxy-6-metoxy-1,4-benzoquinol methylase